VFLHGGPGRPAPINARGSSSIRNTTASWCSIKRGCGRSRRARACREHHLASGRRHRTIAQAPWDRALAGVRRILGQHLGAGPTRRQIPSASAKSYARDFLLRYAEIRWFYPHGASEIFSRCMGGYRDAVPPDERDDFLSAYPYTADRERPEGRTGGRARMVDMGSLRQFLYSNLDNIKEMGQRISSRSQWRESSATTRESRFLAQRRPIAGRCAAHPPHSRSTIVQGRYDVVCPATAPGLARA